jgi:hypothetical protein
MIERLLNYLNLHWWRYSIRYETIPGSTTTLYVMTRTCVWTGITQEGHDFKWQPST